MTGKVTIVKTLSKEELEEEAKAREAKEAEEKRIAEEAAGTLHFECNDADVYQDQNTKKGDLKRSAHFCL